MCLPPILCLCPAVFLGPFLKNLRKRGDIVDVRFMTLLLTTTLPTQGLRLHNVMKCLTTFVDKHKQIRRPPPGPTRHMTSFICKHSCKSHGGLPVQVPDPNRVVVAEGPGGRGAWGGGGGSRGRPGRGVQGAPTYILQNDRHVALIILRYACWGQNKFLKKLPLPGWVPAAMVSRGAGGWVGSILFLMFLSSFLNSPLNSERLSINTWSEKFLLTQHLTKKISLAPLAPRF